MIQFCKELMRFWFLLQPEVHRTAQYRSHFYTIYTHFVVGRMVTWFQVKVQCFDIECLVLVAVLYLQELWEEEEYKGY